MTELLYMNDSYLQECEAKVIEVNNNLVVLDKTIFYPEGGGQPTDVGKLMKDNIAYNVIFVKKLSGNITHQVDKEGLKVGDVVKCVIDWERRYKLMRMHTAAHVFSTAVYKQTGAKITGNQLNVEQSRIDFDLENFDKEKLQSYVDLANEQLASGLYVTTKTMPREEAMKIPDVVKLASVLPPAIKELRIVSIGDFDVQADGGTHVKNTREVGKIQVVSTENKGANNRRAYFVLV